VAKVSLEITGKDKGASAAVKGVTSSIITAQLAVEGIKIATKALINVGKESIQAFRDMTIADSKVTAALKATKGAAGITRTELDALVEQMHELSGIEKTTIQETEGLMLTFTKVSKDVFPEAIERAADMSEMFGQDLKQSAIQLGTALNDPIAGVGRLKRIGISFTEEQKKSIQTFMDQNDIMSAQKVILDELNAEFGGISKTVGSTFEGSIRKLTQSQVENKEAFGNIIRIIGKDFVDGMINAQHAINSFLTDADKIAAIGATFDVVKEVLKDVGKNAFGVLKDSVSDIMGSFGNLTKGLKGTFSAFDILSGAIRIMNMGITVAIKVLKTIIQQQIDWINVLKNVGLALAAVFQALLDPTKWGEAKKQLAEVKDSFKDMASNVLENTKDIIGGVVDEFKNFPQNVKADADRYAKVWEVTNQKIKDDFKKTNKDIIDTQNEGSNDLISVNEQLLKEFSDYYKTDRELAENAIHEKTAAFIAEGVSVTDAKAWEADQLQKLNMKIVNDSFTAAQNIKGIYTDTGNYIANATGEMFNTMKDTFVEIGKIMSDETATGAEKVIAIMQGLLEATSGILSSIQSMYNSHYEEQFAAEEEATEARLEAQDEWANREMEAQGVRLATKQEQLNQEIEILNGKLATETDAEQKASIQQQIIDKEKELKRQQILDEAEKKKAEIQKKAKDKEMKLKKKQFEENKAFSIAQIWINAASAVIGWWAAFASMGIPGIVLAAVMTAATLAMAGVQTGLVASQTFHGQEGGEVPIGTATGDRAVTFMNKGEALLKNEDYKALVGMARGESRGSTYSIATINMYGVNDPVTFAERLNDLQRRERNR
jgi:hypothetical protein